MTNAIEGRANKGKKGNRSGLLRWIQGPSDLPVTVTVPLESVLQKFKFIMKTFVITQGSGPLWPYKSLDPYMHSKELQITSLQHFRF
jgi:hypothetical protein